MSFATFCALLISSKIKNYRQNFKILTERTICVLSVFSVFHRLNNDFKQVIAVNWKTNKLQFMICIIL